MISKEEHQNTIKLGLALATGAVSLFILLFIAIVAHQWYGNYRLRLPFDSTSWKDPQKAFHQENPVRIRMIDDLLAKTSLKGMKKAEVLDLLGNPDDTSKWKSWGSVYWLGPERSFMSIDSEWLVLRFGEDGRVDEVSVVRD